MSLYDLNPNDLDEYIARNSAGEDQLLYELNRHTHLTTYHPRMISGPIVGKFLEFLARIHKAECVLEIGTFTGYSAICLARGMDPKGHLHTIEMNDEVVEIAQQYIARAGLNDRVTIHVGNALEVIPSLNYSFDLVLIDGDKREYPQYLEAIAGKVKPGGIIIADNVLWDGKVVDSTEKDPFTNALREFNSIVTSRSDLENLLLPLRDGLMVILKSSKR